MRRPLVIFCVLSTRYNFLQEFSQLGCDVRQDESEWQYNCHPSSPKSRAQIKTQIGLNGKTNRIWCRHESDKMKITKESKEIESLCWSLFCILGVITEKKVSNSLIGSPTASTQNDKETDYKILFHLKY